MHCRVSHASAFLKDERLRPRAARHVDEAGVERVQAYL